MMPPRTAKSASDGMMYRALATPKTGVRTIRKRHASTAKGMAITVPIATASSVSSMCWTRSAWIWPHWLVT